MIQKAIMEDAKAVADLAVQMWRAHTSEELEAEFRDFIQRDSGAVFIAVLDGRTVGFAQCGLRHDYVEGTETSPVGYLEGVFVEEEYRGRGIAGEMAKACEQWAKEQGCREFASDCELGNEDSLKFHLRAGFKEANRIICFTKEL